MLQNDLPDGALLVEVDEDDIISDTGQTPPHSFPPDCDIQLPMTLPSNGSQKNTFLERRKEKGILSNMAHINSAVSLLSLFYLWFLQHTHSMLVCVYLGCLGSVVVRASDS